MNTRELIAIGFPAGACAHHAKQVLQQAHAAKLDMAIVAEDLKRLAASPSSFVDHEMYGELARKLRDHIAAQGSFRPRESDAPYRVWGADLEADALTQMRNACKLPVAVTGALMPDAHVGYGLPIGGVLATKDAVIHRHVIRALGVQVLLDVENHHNFAWRERHVLPDGSEDELIVHRKGATPAGEGVLGIIPGSMGTPGYVVRGKGVAASLNSASHGAGRRMSRKKAKELFSWDAVQAFLRERDVTLISAGLDEVPMAYKDIDAVMAAQRDLVEPLARFEPRLVKMAPSGEPPED